MKRMPKGSSLILLLVFQLLVGSGLGLYVANYYYSSQDLFLPGTTILGQSVGGLTIDKAEELLMEELYLPENLGFVWDEKEFTLPLAKGVTFFDLKKEIDQAYQLGEEQDFFDAIRWTPKNRNIHLYLEIEPTFLQEGIERFSPLIEEDPKDAELIVIKGVPFVEPSKNGYSLLVDLSVETTTEYVREGVFQEIPLQVLVLPPDIVEEDLPDFSYRRAFYKTPIDEEQENRNHNIALSLDAFNTMILEPQDTISFNERVGRVNVADGYRQAIIIVNNHFTEGLGGGICQVATTLYQVALRGELDIIERTPHTREVQYVPGGFDAAISYNQLDLVIRNNKEFPLLLTTYLDDHVNISLYGPRTELGRKVDLISEKDAIIPPPVQEVPDPKLPIGQKRVVQEGKDGSRYHVYRIIFQDDELESRQLISTDSYHPVPRIIAVGTMMVK